PQHNAHGGRRRRRRTAPRLKRPTRRPEKSASSQRGTCEEMLWRLGRLCRLTLLSVFASSANVRVRFATFLRRPAPPLPPPSVMKHHLRSLVAVSRDAQREEFLDVLAESADYDVVIFESIERGYSRVKQVLPDLVLVYMDIDDVGGSQLLSMLKTDRSLSGIFVETCATAGAAW